MWKFTNRLLFNESSKFFIKNFNLISLKRRNFLSEAYYCNEVWNQRLKSPLLQKVNLDEFYYELDQNYQNSKNISAVDVDVFANAVKDEEHINELADLVHKLRLSADCINTHKSTEHAVIRILIDTNKPEKLLEILDDRLNYGIFLEPFEANILMNRYIKEKQYGFAAKIATQLMLQEDFEHDLARKFAALSSYLYFKNPSEWPKGPEPEPEPEEEIKVRVKYIRNPYFDDHFDLRDPNHLVGKTLAMIGSQNDDILHNSLKVLGLTKYEKLDDALKFVDELKKANKKLYKDILPFIENNESVSKAIADITIIDGNIQNELEKQVKESERIWAERDIAEQCKLYQIWEQNRLNKLEEQKQRLMRAKRIENVEEIKKTLKDEEQKLWFFENEEKIELQIESNKVYYRKRWFGKKKKPRKIDENYIPPEVGTKKD